MSASQPVACAADGQNDLRGAGLRLNLLPQTFDVNGQGVVVHKFPRRVPQLVQQPVPGENHVGVIEEDQQQAVLQRGEKHLLPLLLHHAAGGVHRQAMEGKDRGGAAGFPQGGGDPRQELPWAEGLGDVVIAPQAQPSDDAVLVCRGGEEEHGDRLGLLDCGADGKAVSIGQGDIHQGQVQGGLLQTGCGGTLGGGMDHGEALRLKQAGEMPGKGLLILHQKNSFHGEAPSFLDR